MSKLDIMRVWKKAEESQPHRTSIEELSAIGYELSKEDRSSRIALPPRCAAADHDRPCRPRCVTAVHGPRIQLPRAMAPYRHLQLTLCPRALTASQGMPATGSSPC